MTVEYFKIKEGGFKEIRKETILKSIPILLISSGGGMLIFYFNYGPDDINLLAMLIIIPVILLSMSFGFFIAMKRQKELLETYTIIIADDSITREQKSTLSIFIPNSEIRDIIKNKNGSFIIKGDSKLNVITIPAQIENPENLEQLLNNIKTISVKTKDGIMTKLGVPMALLMVGLMYGVYVPTDKAIVLCAGTLSLAILGFSFYQIQINKNVDNRTKRTRWLTILVFASIIGTMVIKLMAK